MQLWTFLTGYQSYDTPHFIVNIYGHLLEDDEMVIGGFILRNRIKNFNIEILEDGYAFYIFSTISFYQLKVILATF